MDPSRLILVPIHKQRGGVEQKRRDANSTTRKRKRQPPRVQPLRTAKIATVDVAAFNAFQLDQQSKVYRYFLEEGACMSQRVYDVMILNWHDIVDLLLQGNDESSNAAHMTTTNEFGQKLVEMMNEGMPFNPSFNRFRTHGLKFDDTGFDFNRSRKGWIAMYHDDILECSSEDNVKPHILRIYFPEHVSVAVWYPSRNSVEYFNSSGGSVHDKEHIHAVTMFLHMLFDGQSPDAQRAVKFIRVNSINLQTCPMSNVRDNYCASWILWYLVYRIAIGISAKDLMSIAHGWTKADRFEHIQKFHQFVQSLD
jgi:hypothetical protein